MVPLLLALACGRAAVAVPVLEVFDVPPPPGHRSLAVGPVPTSAMGREPDPGDRLVLRAPHGALVLDGDVVDVRHGGGGLVVTVYADEAGAARALEHAGPVVLSVR